MATGKIPIYTNLIHTTAPTVDQLKNAKAIIVHYGVSDNSSKGTLALIPDDKATAFTAVWNGAKFFYTVASIGWSKANGTVTITNIYSERPNATVSIIGYDLFF